MPHTVEKKKHTSVQYVFCIVCILQMTKIEFSFFVDKTLFHVRTQVHVCVAWSRIMSV